ncbi:16S rRNA (cytidine(1402)-2'-O)-methyltransferase [Candidatus Gottesmanbacteria bacterium]|nr:16S rRNA (cytidine(1402)-2'-O)-methyltransferase [Candidatus Gottesmanbacteria bacterium]
MSTLYVVSTPIGNLEDITIRAMRIIFSIDYIACEDTRKTGQLLQLLSDKYSFILNNLNIIKKKPILISFYDEIENIKTPYLLNLLHDNHDIALVSDNGTPLIADPGFKLVQSCIKEGIKVVPIPGASSPITALTVSAFPPNKFTFIGFLPIKNNKRLELYKNIQESVWTDKQTYILLEAPHRIEKTLDEILQIFGDIQIVIARELTKLHEEIIRGNVSEIKDNIMNLKGELVVLFTI